MGRSHPATLRGEHLTQFQESQLKAGSELEKQTTGIPGRSAATFKCIWFRKTAAEHPGKPGPIWKEISPAADLLAQLKLHCFAHFAATKGGGGNQWWRQADFIFKLHLFYKKKNVFDFF